MVMLECGEGDLGWALWKSWGLFSRSCVLSSCQGVCGSLAGKRLRGKGRICFVVRVAHKFGLFGTLDKEFTTMVSCIFYSLIRN